LNFLKKLTPLFAKKHSDPLPLLIIKKNADDANVKEYTSIEEAIVDLENDPNVSSVKIEKLRSSFKNLKNKSTIRIKDGELIK
jgi:2,3-bisphosphoglycerate-independent phosphoglycerate mutase